MMLEQGQDIRVFNIRSTQEEGRGKIIIMMTKKINESYDADDVHNDNDDERSRW